MASSEAMAADSSPEPSILNKSLKLLLSRNAKPILPIFLLSLIPCSLMLLSSSGPINPLILESLTMPYPADTSVPDYFRQGFDPRSYDIKALSTITICHLLFYVPIVAGIRSLFLICAGEQLSPRQSMMAIIKSLSMASFFTRLCVTVLGLANKYLTLALFAQNLEAVLLILIYTVLLLLGVYILPVLSVLALVVAAVEGRCGVSALKRAMELVGRRGRWKRATALVLFVIIDPSFYQILNLALSYVDGRPGQVVVWAAMRVVQVAGVAALGMWALAAHVMFYWEVGKECKEEAIAVVDEGREKGSDEYSALAGDQDHPVNSTST